jgi:hypothetical protein
MERERSLIRWYLGGDNLLPSSDGIRDSLIEVLSQYLDGFAIVESVGGTERGYVIEHRCSPDLGNHLSEFLAVLVSLALKRFCNQETVLYTIKKESGKWRRNISSKK